MKGGLKTKGLFTKKSEEGRPLVTIVTPVYNGETYLEETIQSITNQTYDNIEYIIIDGGSTDGTLDIIKKYEDKIAYWVSEPDKGMYDGINKGFKMATGEIFAWLNSDDKYYHSAVEMVVMVFNKYPKIEWITGIPTSYDKDGLIVEERTPICYSRKFLRMGLYRGDILGCIQQESTFWRRSLWEKAGGLNSDLQFAGDYDLWIRFSKHVHLYTVPTVLGGFRMHPGQKSSNREMYYAECGAIKRIKFKGFWGVMRYPMGLLAILLYKSRKSKNKMIVYSIYR